MSDESTGDQIADFAGGFLRSIFFEKIAHKQIRQGFVLGWAIIGASIVGLGIWMHFHPDIHSNVTLAGVSFFVATSLLGSMVQTDTDIADQQSGRYSKWGSGWNWFGDNLFSNQVDKIFETIAICGCLIAVMYFASAAAAEKHSVVKSSATPKVEAYKSPLSAAHAGSGHHSFHSKHVQPAKH